MTIILSIIITITGFTIAYKFWDAIRKMEIKRQIELDPQEKYQDGRHLIDEANGQLLKQIDLTAIRETNPKLYYQLKKNNKTIMERITAQRNKHKTKFIHNVMKLKG